MLTMFPRRLKRPGRSFFLFGPRGTGKSTWLRQVLEKARWYDLLHSEVYFRLLAEPAQFRREVEALRPGWVVVDEVQRIPALLDEVHSLIARHGKRWSFALCGSSARKLKRLDANLLAGRVINRSFFPLVHSELGQDIPTSDVLRFGLLPDVRNEPRAATDILEAYAANYLREEVQQEALTRDLAAFSRFLRVAGLLSGQVVNVTNIASESAVARPTVQRYFEVLVDTLIGVWLRAWQPRLKVREVAHPKFYFFDCGVARAAAGRLRAPLHDSERGPLLETWMLHELRAHLAFTNIGGDLSYYRTPSGVEVDFIWTGPKHSVGIEVKSSEVWRRGFGSALRELHDRKVIRRAVGVYEGEHAQKDGPVEILPVREFFQRLPGILR
jgi:predicted AAA+ superfamily ATPase